MCDHDFKIIATHELRQQLGHKNAVWNIRVCLTCGVLNSSGEITSKWRVGYVNKIAYHSTNLIQRTSLMIDSIQKEKHNE